MVACKAGWFSKRKEKDGEMFFPSNRWPPLREGGFSLSLSLFFKVFRPGFYRLGAIFLVNDHSVDTHNFLCKFMCLFSLINYYFSLMFQWNLPIFSPINHNITHILRWVNMIKIYKYLKSLSKQESSYTQHYHFNNSLYMYLLSYI